MALWDTLSGPSKWDTLPGPPKKEPTPKQKQAYYDQLLAAGESSMSEAQRHPWTSTAPQHGFRGPALNREQAPQPTPKLSPLEKAKDTYAQLSGALGSTSMKVPEGLLRLAGDEKGADKIRTEYEKQIARIGPAKSGWGVAGGMVGTVGAFAPAMLAGGGALVPSLVAGAAMDLPAAASGRDFSVLGMIADWRKKKAEKEGRPLSPVEARLEQGAEHPWARGAVDTGFGLTAGLLGDLLPGARAARRAEDARLLERSTPPLPPLMKEADQAAVDKIMQARRIAERDKVKLPKYEGPERRASTRLESRMMPEIEIPPSDRRLGAAHPAVVKAIARTGIGAVGGSVAASPEGGVTPLQGAALGAVAVNVPAAVRALRPGLPAAAAEEVARTKQLFREFGGTLARKGDVAVESVAEDAARWRKVGDLAGSKDPAVQATARQAHVDFMDRAETGNIHTMVPEDQRVATALRTQLDQRRDQLKKMGKLDQAIQDYMGRLFQPPKNPTQNVVAQTMGKRPLRGSTGFLKPRTFATYREAINAGMEPVTWNPVEMQLLKIRQMDRFIAFEKVKTELKNRGLITFSRERQIPAGFSRIEDPSFEVWDRGPKGENIRRGQYIAPDHVANVINRFTAPTVLGNQTWFRAMRGASNAVNQLQLLGPFHAAFESLDAVFGRVALAYEHGSRGQVGKALKNLAIAPVAPVEQILKGSKVLREWKNPGTYPELTKIVDAIAAGGGRAKMDRHFSNQALQAMQAAARQGGAGGILKAIGWSVPAAIEGAMKPVMEHMVPRMKLAAFSNVMDAELERLGSSATHDQIADAAVKAWNSIDNRMGQLVYDNLFWDRTGRDAAHLMVRSVGWNYGTVRELGGGALDLGKLLGPKPELTHRAAYLLAVNTVTPLMGAGLTYLMTGKGPRELKDYYFPPTGKVRPDGSEDRISLPSYAKDEFAWLSHPIQTASHKAGPLVNPLWEMYHNADFYGAEIVDPTAPWQDQVAQIGRYARTQATPFSVRNVMRMKEYGEPLGRQLSGLVGVTPAPADIARSPFQSLLHTRYAETLPRGARSQAEVEQSRKGAAATYSMRRGEVPELTGLTPAQLTRSINAARTTAEEQRFSRLSLPDQIEVWKKATPEERKKNNLLAHIYSPTFFQRLGNLSEGERARVYGEVQQILTSQGRGTATGTKWDALPGGTR